MGRRKSDQRAKQGTTGGPVAGRSRDGARNWWFDLCLLGSGLAAFANSLSIPFVYDDHLTVVENPHVAHLWSLSHALGLLPPSPTSGRPLVGFSFAVNYALGGLDAWGYHIVNLGIHLAAAMLLFGIVRDRKSVV